MELYKKHRPKKLSEVVGQPEAVTTLRNLVDVPHALLFTGPSGCGKTTLARIVRKRVRCSNHDFKEMNCADFRGIEMVREVRDRMNLAPFGGRSRVWLIDEAHQLTSAAQDAFLKMLEDTPDHVYFMLATTNPEKLKKTIRTRCTEIAVKALSAKDIEAVLRVADETIEEELVDAIVNVAEGSARKALVILDQVQGIGSTDERIEAVQSVDTQKQAIELARALINPKSTWMDIATILRGVNDDPESLRWMVLGYSNTVILKGGKIAARAYLVIDAFRENFYDSKHAGLAAACFEVVHSS